MNYFGILLEFLRFERSNGRNITRIDMSFGYMLIINHFEVPYTRSYETGRERGILKEILGIPVFVDMEDKDSTWIKYEVQS